MVPVRLEALPVGHAPVAERPRRPPLEPRARQHAARLGLARPPDLDRAAPDSITAREGRRPPGGSRSAASSLTGLGIARRALTRDGDDGGFGGARRATISRTRLSDEGQGVGHPRAPPLRRRRLVRAHAGRRGCGRAARRRAARAAGSRRRQAVNCATEAATHCGKGHRRQRALAELLVGAARQLAVLHVARPLDPQPAVRRRRARQPAQGRRGQHRPDDAGGDPRVGRHRGARPGAHVPRRRAARRALRRRRPQAADGVVGARLRLHVPDPGHRRAAAVAILPRRCRCCRGCSDRARRWRRSSSPTRSTASRRACPTSRRPTSPTSHPKRRRQSTSASSKDCRSEAPSSSRFRSEGSSAPRRGRACRSSPPPSSSSSTS